MATALEIRGYDRVVRRIDDYLRRIKEEPFQVKAAINQISRRLYQNTPYKTGNMYRQIRTELRAKSIIITSRAFYSYWVEKNARNESRNWFSRGIRQGIRSSNRIRRQFRLRLRNISRFKIGKGWGLRAVIDIVYS